jgi:hypothetical protein
MPMPRRPHKASPDELKITRNGDDVIIAYADDSLATTHFKLGRERLSTMTDDDIIDFWNEHLEARDAAMAKYEHVAVEVPPGRPQVEFFEQGNQSVPRGHVLRCVVMGSDGTPTSRSSRSTTATSQRASSRGWSAPSEAGNADRVRARRRTS